MEIEPRKQWHKQAAAGIILLALGVFIGRYLLPLGSAATGPLRFMTVNEGQRQLIFPTFWEAKDQLESKFIGNLNDEALFYGAVKGMVAAANDPYTVFADPSATKQFATRSENIERHSSPAATRSATLIVSPGPGR